MATTRPLTFQLLSIELPFLVFSDRYLVGMIPYEQGVIVIFLIIRLSRPGLAKRPEALLFMLLCESIMPYIEPTESSLIYFEACCWTRRINNGKKHSNSHNIMDLL
jgi:hypothetical protein